jgi:hypothetical protein
MNKYLTFILIGIFTFTSFGFMPSSYAANGVIAQSFSNVTLKGLTTYPDQPLKFDFIVEPSVIARSETTKQSFKSDSLKLIKYFLASLTTPEEDMWVNLSPYEKNRIVPESLGQTIMGRDLLEQDYILKQITASLIHPDTPSGKQFWAKVYTKTQAQFGTTEVPINTFNKVWIMPDKATVWEHDNSVFVMERHLKVMLEEDYLSKDKSRPNNQALQANTQTTKEIIRQIIIPTLEEEVNNGDAFAQLRQIYNAMILATWYKKRLKDSLLGHTYSNRRKTTGITFVPGEKDPQKIYDDYVQTFKKGVFNFIKEEKDATGQLVPRKYFSGGAVGLKADQLTIRRGALALNANRAMLPTEKAMNVKCDFNPMDQAMNSPEWPELKYHLKKLDMKNTREEGLNAILLGLAKHPKVNREPVITRLKALYADTKDEFKYELIRAILKLTEFEDAFVRLWFENAFSSTDDELIVEAMSLSRTVIRRAKNKKELYEYFNANIEGFITSEDIKKRKMALTFYVDVGDFNEELKPTIYNRMVFDLNFRDKYFEALKKMPRAFQTIISIQLNSIGVPVKFELEDVFETARALHPKSKDFNLSKEDIRALKEYIAKAPSPAELLEHIYSTKDIVFFYEWDDIEEEDLKITDFRLIRFIREIIVSNNVKAVALPFPANKAKDIEKLIKGEIPLKDWEYGIYGETDAVDPSYREVKAHIFRLMMIMLKELSVDLIFYETSQSATSEGDLGDMQRARIITDYYNKNKSKILVLGDEFAVSKRQNGPQTLASLIMEEVPNVASNIVAKNFDKMGYHDPQLENILLEQELSKSRGFMIKDTPLEKWLYDEEPFTYGEEWDGLIFWLDDNDGPNGGDDHEVVDPVVPDEELTLANRAMLSTVEALNVKGGIDLNSNALKLEIKRDGKGIPLSASQQNWSQVSIEGIEPVITSIEPVNVSFLKGINS